MLRVSLSVLLWAICIAALAVIGISALNNKTLDDQSWLESTNDASPITANPVPAAQSPHFEPPALSKFSSITERPLFNPSRRPVTGEVTAVNDSVPEPSIPRLRLSGVSISNAGKSAVLADVANKTFRVRENDEFDGWTVSNIEHNRVILINGGQTQILPLKSQQ